MSWIGAAASGFAGGMVAGATQNRPGQTMRDPVDGRDHPRVSQHQSKDMPPRPMAERQISTDTRWAEAESIRNAGREAQAEGRQHVDNAAAAARDFRAFEAARETSEAGRAALTAQSRYHDANRVEWEAAQDQVQKATDYRHAQRDVDMYYANGGRDDDRSRECTDYNERSDSFSRYDHSDQSNRSGGCINS